MKITSTRTLKTTPALSPGYLKCPSRIPRRLWVEDCQVIFVFHSHLLVSLRPVSPQVNLGSHQYLFTVDVNPSEMPCLCLRHDVDALVWQPHPEQPANMWEHVATFNALGKSFNLYASVGQPAPQSEAFAAVSYQNFLL